MRLSDSALRRLSLAVGLAGVVHLAVPECLLQTAQWGYRRLLAVEFDPKPGATRRVRLVGIAFLAVAFVVRRLSNR